MAGVVEALFASARASDLAGASSDSSVRLEAAILQAAKAGDQEALRTAIEEARGRANLDCAGGFDGNTPLHWAVEKGHTSCVRILCEMGATVDSRERWQNWTPLMIAASKDRRPEAELLLAHGADASLRAKGRAAADLAESPEMASVLRQTRAAADGDATKSTGEPERHGDAPAKRKPRGEHGYSLRQKRKR